MCNVFVASLVAIHSVHTGRGTQQQGAGSRRPRDRTDPAGKNQQQQVALDDGRSLLLLPPPLLLLWVGEGVVTRRGGSERSSSGRWGA